MQIEVIPHEIIKQNNKKKTKILQTVKQMRKMDKAKIVNVINQCNG